VEPRRLSLLLLLLLLLPPFLHVQDKSHALKFVDFLASVTPLRSKAAKQLVSEDVQNGLMKYKFSYAVELVPVCKVGRMWRQYLRLGCRL
jgi:hypothetical protein